MIIASLLSHFYNTYAFLLWNILLKFKSIVSAVKTAARKFLTSLFSLFLLSDFVTSMSVFPLSLVVLCVSVRGVFTQPWPWLRVRGSFCFPLDWNGGKMSLISHWRAVTCCLTTIAEAIISRLFGLF